jgi:flagella basal body P-ring formation protein FlgA
MSRQIRKWPIGILPFVLFGSAVLGQEAPLVVALNAEANVSGPCVLLKDVAKCRGTAPALAGRAAALDLADAPPPGGSSSISKEEVAFRLQLAGIDRQTFRLEGANQVVVRSSGSKRQSDVVTAEGQAASSDAITEQNISTVARQYLLRHLPWPAADVRIQQGLPLQVPALKRAPNDQVRLEPELRSSGSLLGRVFVDVAVLINGRVTAVVPVALDIKLTQELAVASRRIEAGETLSKDNLYTDRRVITQPSQYLTCAECMNGKRAKHPIPAGQLLARGDVEAQTENTVLVKQHDLVKLMARVGPLRVVALGEALQDGSPGQPIRVRNVDSKSIVLGRVVDRSLVEVDY